MRNPIAHLRLLISTVAAFVLPLQSQGATQENKLTIAQVYTNEATQFQFPPSIAEFHRGANFTQYDSAARDISVPYYYSHSPIVVTVFVYPITAKPPNNTLQTHFAKCKADVVGVHEDAKLISEGKIQVTPGVNKQEGMHAVFTFTDSFAGHMQSLRSEAFLFAHRQSFILFRITYPVAEEPKVAPAMKTLMDGLKWP